MNSPGGVRFADQKNGFRQILADPHWLAKVLLGGFLLINPFLIAVAPAYFSGTGPAWVKAVFPWILGFNILSFWFPLGFTYEVLRRARTGRGVQLPDWEWSRLGVFAREGSVKLVIAIFTLLIPTAIWTGTIYLVFMRGFGLPATLLTLFIPPIMLFVIPFCGVACCRWLDGASVLDSALNYKENYRLSPRAVRAVPNISSPPHSSSASIRSPPRSSTPFPSARSSAFASSTPGSARSTPSQSRQRKNPSRPRASRPWHPGSRRVAAARRAAVHRAKRGQILNRKT